MVDVHCHIIPNVDDGSQSVEQTFKMLKEAEKVGFTDIIATSHFIIGHYETDSNELAFWKDKIQEILIATENKLRIYSGMEIYISNDITSLIKENKLLKMANSRYILIELPFNSEVKYFENVMYYLQSYNLIPVIAHPERYKYVQKNPKIVKEYIEQGCLMQCNYGSILELYGKDAKNAVKYLLKHDLVHFLGTDCHKPNSIYKDIPEAVKKIKKLIGEEQFELISTKNPIKILENEELD